MASNFDDIENNSEDEFWIAASYVSVFNQDDPGYFEIGRILWQSWMTSISTQHSAWTSDVSAICSTGSNWSCVTQRNRTVDFWWWRCDFTHRHGCFVSGGLHFRVFYHDKYKWLISNNEAVYNVNSMVSMLNDTPNVNTSHVDAINQ